MPKMSSLQPLASESSNVGNHPYRYSPEATSPWEALLPKQRVEGSSLVSRSRFEFLPLRIAGSDGLTARHGFVDTQLALVLLSLGQLKSPGHPASGGDEETRRAMSRV